MDVNGNIGQKIHFIGIGGVSMSGLALCMKGRGCRVTGSDLAPNEFTLRLERAGVPCELCTVEGADHATAEFSQAGLLRHIADWLDAALGKGRA